MYSTMLLDAAREFDAAKEVVDIMGTVLYDYIRDIDGVVESEGHVWYYLGKLVDVINAHEDAIIETACYNY